jgi:hypothetical protein
MNRRYARRLIQWLLFGLAAPGGCMFLVDDELGSIRCMDEGAYGPPACPAAHACVDGLCAPRPAAAPALGTRCESNADCNDTDFCLDPASFGETGEPVCSRTCCSSIDCDAVTAEGEPDLRAVCWVPAVGGGSFCRDGQALAREESGIQKAGDKCVQHADCRSGVCRNAYCADACCSDTNCDLAASACLVTDGIASEGSSWACAPTPPATSKGYLEPCVSDDECATGLCIKMADELLCSRPCCDSASCGPIATANTSGHVACVHLPHHGSFVAACARVLPITAELAVGAPCTDDLECRSGICAAAKGTMTRYCADLCCVDADCGDPTLACRPQPFGDTQALHCALQ